MNTTATERRTGRQHRTLRQNLRQNLRRTLPALLAAVLLTLALAACGGRSGEGGSAPASSGAAGTTAAAEHATHDAHAEHDADADTEHVAHAEQDSDAQHAAHAQHAADDAHDAHAEHPADDPHANHAAHADALAAAPLPGTSVYHLTSPFIDQDGEELLLSELRGGPAVFVMFYGDCTTACPLLVRSAEEIEAALPDDLKDDTRFVMVSFDTDRDTPEKLKAYAQEKGLTNDNWHWLVGSPLLTRQLATLLGVQYRDAGNGVFAHSNLVTVLDADGVPSARLEGLGVKLEPAVAAVRAAAR